VKAPRPRLRRWAPATTGRFTRNLGSVFGPTVYLTLGRDPITLLPHGRLDVVVRQHCVPHAFLIFPPQDVLLKPQKLCIPLLRAWFEVRALLPVVPGDRLDHVRPALTSRVDGYVDGVTVEGRYCDVPPGLGAGGR